MRILADKVIAEAEQAFEAYGSVELFDGRELDKRLVATADILLVRSVTRVDKALLAGTPVKFVGTATAGVDHVDQTALNSLGIRFHSAPGCNANAVAEFIATSISKFCIEHNIAPQSCSVGIIGHGQVGTRVENKLTVLGYECILNDPPKAAATQDRRYVDLETALRADIVTLHTPFTSGGDYPTEDLIDKQAISGLPNCRLLINAARGGIVDENALLRRIQDDPQFNVQIDCWQGEPEIDLELLRRSYVCSPHVAGHSMEARRNATRQLAEALTEWSGIKNPWLNNPVEEGSPSAKIAEVVSRFERLGAENNGKLLADIMQQCCPVNTIDQATRGLADISPGKRIQHFDHLRRQFAGRREFSFSKLPIAVLSVVGQNTLDGLGFRY